MKKIISALLCIVMLAVLFAGCGGTNNSDKNQKGTNQNSGETVFGNDPNANYKVSGTVSVGINSFRNSDFEAICNEFKKLFPNVTVEPILFESSTDDATEYLTGLSMAGKKLPDILFDDAGGLPTYITNGWMYPLSSFLKGDSDFEDVPKNIVDHLSYHDTVYALGQTLHSNAVIINTDLVDELNLDLPEFDWNWNDFKAFLKSCTNSTYSGIDDLSQAYNWLPGAMSENTTVFSYNYDTKQFDLTAEQKAVNYILELRNLKSVEATSLKLNAASGTSDYVKKFGNISGSGAAFLAGKTAAIFAGTWSYASYAQQELPFNWEYYPVPQVVKGRIPLHVDFCWMTTDVAKENIDAAWQFLRFVTYSKEGNLARLSTYDEDHITSDMLNAYYMPCTSNKDVLAKFESLPEVTDAILYIMDNMKNAYLGDPEKTVPGFEDVGYVYIGKPAYESISGQYDFTSKMADSQSKANKRIKEYADEFETALSKFEAEFSAKNS